MLGSLPKVLTVNGIEYSIRSNYRDVLKIIKAFNDPELEPEEKVYTCLFILYKDFEAIPQTEYEEAFKTALDFIDYGIKDTQKSPRVMDWEQDELLIFPAINKVAGFEIRTVKYLHWWTVLGYYMEIPPEGAYSTILSMRMKKAKHKKLEKWEQEYWNANKSICVLAPKLTAEEQAAKDRLNKMLD